MHSSGRRSALAAPQALAARPQAGAFSPLVAWLFGRLQKAVLGEGGAARNKREADIVGFLPEPPRKGPGSPQSEEQKDRGERAPGSGEDPLFS